MHPSIRELEKEMGKKQIDRFEVGDTVDVHVRIVEGEKERIQVFSGIVISRRGSGLSEMFTVRRLVQGEGVERTFPLHSPRVERIEVKRQGKKRRAKLYFLRQRVGKGTRLAEDKRSRDAVSAEAGAPETPEAVAQAQTQ